VQRHNAYRSTACVESTSEARSAGWSGTRLKASLICPGFLGVGVLESGGETGATPVGADGWVCAMRGVGYCLVPRS
jgi:hypothetical protein